MLLSFYFKIMSEMIFEEENNETWRHQGRVRSIRYRLHERARNLMRQRHESAMKQNLVTAVASSIYLPFILKNISILATPARMRLLRDYKERFGLTGFDMYKMEEDIERKEGPHF